MNFYFIITIRWYICKFGETYWRRQRQTGLERIILRPQKSSFNGPLFSFLVQKHLEGWPSLNQILRLIAFVLVQDCLKTKNFPTWKISHSFSQRIRTPYLKRNWVHKNSLALGLDAIMQCNASRKPNPSPPAQRRPFSLYMTFYFVTHCYSN